MKGQKTYLIDVATISKSSGHESLSYFSTEKIAPGTIVRVSIRKSLVTGVALRSRDVKSAKSDIRRAGFFLKKISKKDILDSSLPRHFLTAIEETARYYATPVGDLLAGILPKAMLDEPDLFLKTWPVRKKKRQAHSTETLLLQMETEERFAQYRALVRQAFARGASVIFVAPTHSDLARVLKELSRGIEEFVYLWSLSLKGEAIRNVWHEAQNNPHPILFITTPAGISFTRGDLDTIILDRENSRAYRTLTRPYFHYKVFIENLAKVGEQQLALGDSILSLETLWREKSGEYGENSLIRWRLSAAQTILADAKSTQEQNGRFEIFSHELQSVITEAIAEKEPIFLFGARKGLSPTTVCGDCGTVLPCTNCGAPVVLHQRSDFKYNPQGPTSNRVYVCHACKSTRDSTTTCGYCGSWKLVPLGIGTQEIARHVRELFPHQHVAILDKDHASTDAKARNIIKKFKEQGGILVGTELAFFHLESVPYSGVVSLDSLFSVPDFGINERIFYLVSRLREMTKKKSVIQTRNIGKQILAWASSGNIVDFYQSEIAERKSLLYPPFSIFIKITVLKRELGSVLPKLKTQFAKWHPDIFKDSLVMRIGKDVWPSDDLLKELSLLPPQFSIKVDTESIL